TGNPSSLQPTGRVKYANLCDAPTTSMIALCSAASGRVENPFGYTDDADTYVSMAEWSTGFTHAAFGGSNWGRVVDKRALAIAPDWVVKAPFLSSNENDIGRAGWSYQTLKKASLDYVLANAPAVTTYTPYCASAPGGSFSGTFAMGKGVASGHLLFTAAVKNPTSVGKWPKASMSGYVAANLDAGNARSGTAIQIGSDTYHYTTWILPSYQRNQVNQTASTSLIVTVNERFGATSETLCTLAPHASSSTSLTHNKLLNSFSTVTGGTFGGLTNTWTYSDFETNARWTVTDTAGAPLRDADLVLKGATTGTLTCRTNSAGQCDTSTVLDQDVQVFVYHQLYEDAEFAVTFPTSCNNAPLCVRALVLGNVTEQEGSASRVERGVAITAEKECFTASIGGALVANLTRSASVDLYVGMWRLLNGAAVIQPPGVLPWYAGESNKFSYTAPPSGTYTTADAGNYTIAVLNATGYPLHFSAVRVGGTACGILPSQARGEIVEQGRDGVRTVRRDVQRAQEDTDLRSAVVAAVTWAFSSPIPDVTGMPWMVILLVLAFIFAFGGKAVTH
ncbi:MAG TPA: hypothetical protein VI997_11555, partial [Candidatus Thermoplasmatota archaeon]|nr:hypothetical protein [Candidatus Thermoplasmatota archaeon]